jgi:predicted ATP-grasp superfamily ATP-dependent carboligase
MALHSKYAKDIFVYPSPYQSQDACIESLIDAAKRCAEKPLVFAFSDATYLALYAHREKITPYVNVQFPESKSIEIAFDKAATYSLARISGVPTIPTHIPEMGDELRRVAEGMTYPAVVKTRRSVTWVEGKGVFGTAQFVQHKDELVRLYTKLKERTGEAPLIQPCIRGEEYGVEMLARKGKVYACVVHHRIRSLSPTGGASVYKETLEDGDLKHTLTAYADVLVQKLEWEGPIMVEFKVDADTREPYLMEINGRFWGSLPLSVFAGVDVPMLYARAVGEGVVPTEPVTARAGVRSMHHLGDVRHMLRVLFARDPMRSVLYPRRMQALRDFVSFPRGVHNDVWSFGDMKPALMEIIDVIMRKRT